MKSKRTFLARKPINRKHHHSTKYPLLLLGILLLVIGSLYFIGRRGPQSNLGGFLSFRQSPVVTTAFAEKATNELTSHSQTPELPLYLQKDPRWQDCSYGTEASDNTLAKNGCALASLAMIASYWQRQAILPSDILEWAGNSYYVQGQGTSWQIFSDYAANYGYQYQDLGGIFSSAMDKMRAGIPIIASVAPGTFTTSGHILVLSLDQNGQIRAYDPNDDADKQHYTKTFSEETFRKEGINYWALWR